MYKFDFDGTNIGPMAVAKAKFPVVEDDYYVWLDVTILFATDIDEETTNYNKRLYTVFGWVGPEAWIQTLTVCGLPDPVWNARFCIPLGKLVHSRHLSLEIYRTQSTSDPCTSTGNVLVGRTLIPLSVKEINLSKNASYDLVVLKGPNCMVGGSIFVATNMIKIYKF